MASAYVRRPLDVDGDMLRAEMRCTYTLEMDEEQLQESDVEYSSDEDQLGAEFAHLRLRAEEEVEEIEEEVENLYTMAIQSAERTLLDLHVTSKFDSENEEYDQSNEGLMSWPEICAEPGAYVCQNESDAESVVTEAGSLDCNDEPVGLDEENYQDERFQLAALPFGHFIYNEMEPGYEPAASSTATGILSHHHQHPQDPQDLDGSGGGSRMFQAMEDGDAMADEVPYVRRVRRAPASSPRAHPGDAGRGHQELAGPPVPEDPVGEEPHAAEDAFEVKDYGLGSTCGGSTAGASSSGGQPDIVSATTSAATALEEALAEPSELEKRLYEIQEMEARRAKYLSKGNVGFFSPYQLACEILKATDGDGADSEDERAGGQPEGEQSGEAAPTDDQKPSGGTSVCGKGEKSRVPRKKGSMQPQQQQHSHMYSPFAHQGSMQAPHHGKKKVLKGTALPVVGSALAGLAKVHKQGHRRARQLPLCYFASKTPFVFHLGRRVETLQPHKRRKDLVKGKQVLICPQDVQQLHQGGVGTRAVKGEGRVISETCSTSDVSGLALSGSIARARADERNAQMPSQTVTRDPSMAAVSVDNSSAGAGVSITSSSIRGSNPPLTPPRKSRRGDVVVSSLQSTSNANSPSTSSQSPGLARSTPVATDGNSYLKNSSLLASPEQPGTNTAALPGRKGIIRGLTFRKPSSEHHPERTVRGSSTSRGLFIQPLPRYHSRSSVLR